MRPATGKSRLLAAARSLVAVVTLLTTTAALAPAVAVPADRHCQAGHELAVTAGSDHACHPATEAPCATGGCLTHAAAVTVPAGAAVPAAADHAGLPPRSERVTCRLATGPPTPPPNS